MVTEGDGLVLADFELMGESSSSGLFASTGEFADFISGGRVSIAPAVNPGQLNVVTLEKEEASFDPVCVTAVNACRILSWAESGIRFDSCYSTRSGNYTWKLLGQVAR